MGGGVDKRRGSRKTVGEEERGREKERSSE